MRNSNYVTLPTLAITYVHAAYSNVPVVAGVLGGFKPVVVTIVVETDT